MQWIDGSIRRPQAEMLTREEFRKLFSVSEEWLDERIKVGVLPAPLSLSAKTKFYTWEHAVYLSLWLRFVANAQQNVEKQGQKKSGE